MNDFTDPLSVFLDNLLLQITCLPCIPHQECCLSPIVSLGQYEVRSLDLHQETKNEVVLLTYRFMVQYNFQRPITLKADLKMVER